MSDYHVWTRKTWAAIVSEISETMRKWDIPIWAVDCKLQPRSTAKIEQTADERRVTLRYRNSAKAPEVVLSIDTQRRAVDNLLTLALAVEDLRMNEKRGIAPLVAQAYAQLPPPGAMTPVSQPAATNPYRVLGVVADSPLDVIEAAYRALAKKHHPDLGGNPVKAAEINAAMDTIRKERL